uniref:Bromo domain-containing protein n=1 Tax=Calcidiscus leptoporus TaxID=127549 RepID=A0A7S0IW54_9EUKA|mmetsp:Transcript_24820/g.57869  ORF Transcript_24820/g.57869 Transcript_24820/m.57869 type:complete len:344 (+) Transcript_24820:149-1180(+)
MPRRWPPTLIDSTLEVLKPIDGAVAAKLEVIMRTLRKRKDSAQFLEPVDCVQMKLPNYPQIIKQPMDLGTVERNLKRDTALDFAEKQYQFVEEFAHDVRLVWKNAFLFNQPNHDVFKAAKKLALVFEEQLAALHEELDKEGPPCPKFARCQILLSDMCGNCLSEWFRRDDWKQFGEEYRTMIKSGQPMDLFAVQAWLDEQPKDAGEQVVREFYDLTRLVWSNAIDFNQANSWIGTIAHVLSENFERRFKLIDKAPRPPSVQPIEERAGWPTFEQKQQLFQHCTGLSLREASLLAQEVRKRCPAAISSIDKDRERESVDLDKLDSETFTYMDALRLQKVARQSP